MDKEKPSFYAVLPSNVRYDKRICSSSKVLYAEITALCDFNGKCWASNSYFADLYDVSPKSISIWIKQLAKFGYIKVEYKYKDGSKEIECRHIYIVENQNIQKNQNFQIEQTETEAETLSRDIAKEKIVFTEDHLLVAETIKGIEESKSSKEINKKTLNQWADEIRKLEKIDKVPIERIIQVAKWYAVHFNDNKYIPVAESGRTFREKFSRIEAAMNRSTSKEDENNFNPSVLELILMQQYTFENEMKNNGGRLHQETKDSIMRMVNEEKEQNGGYSRDEDELNKLLEKLMR